MITNAVVVDDDDDDDDDYENEFALDFLEAHEWEDNAAYRQIVATVPKGWHLIKIANYNYQTLLSIEEYLNDEFGTIGWKKVRWSNGYCSYSTGIMVEGVIAATKLRLRYGG